MSAPRRRAPSSSVARSAEPVGSALHAVDEHRRHRDPRRRDRHGLDDDRDVAGRVQQRRRAATPARPSPPSSSPSADDEPAAAAGRGTLRRRAGPLLVRERRDGREPGGRIQRPAPRHQRALRDRHPDEGQVGHRRRGRRGRDSPTSRPRRGRPCGCPTPTRGCRWPGRTAARQWSRRGHERRDIRHRAGHARAARPGHRLGRGAAAVAGRLRRRRRRRPVGRPRSLRVGRVQTRQDQPGRRHLRRGRDVRLLRHRRGIARRDHRCVGLRRVRARTSSASTNWPRATTWPPRSTSCGMRARPSRPVRPRTSSRRSSSTRSRSGTTTAASPAATA